MLGAGGLVRAYSKGASIALDAADILTMEIADSLKITVDYTFYGNVTAIASEYHAIVKNTDYADNVNVFIDVKSEYTEELKNKLIDKCNGRVDIEFIDKGYKEI